jgi:hypothetical protein
MQEKSKAEAKPKTEAKPEAKPVAEESKADPSGWSNEQQKQLEAGMREFPGTIPVKERWIKISEKVEGKTPKECYERFKEIVALLKKQ